MPALVIRKVDYCISVLVGTSGHLLDRLQSFLNAAAHLVFESRRSDHITSLLPKRHWLKIRERIQFRLCVLTFRCLNGTTPRYLADGLHRTIEVAGRRCLRSADTTTLTVPATHRRLVRPPREERQSLAEGVACRKPPAERLSENGQVGDSGEEGY